MHNPQRQHQRHPPRTHRVRLDILSLEAKTASGKIPPRKSVSGKWIARQAAPRLDRRRLAVNIASDCLDQNNRQLHPDEKTLAKKLAANSKGKYTAEQIEDAMRASGNKALGEDVNAGTIVGGMIDGKPNSNTAYDQDANWSINSVNGIGLNLVQKIPTTVDSALAAYIQGNTGSTYNWSDNTLGKVSTGTSTPNTNPFDSRWNTGNYSGGLTPDTTPEQHHDNMVDMTDKASTGLGIAAIWTPPPLDVALLAMSLAFKAANYNLNPPNKGEFTYDAITTIVPIYLPNGHLFQTGISIGGTLLQPIVTPALDNTFKKLPTYGGNE